MRVIEARPVGQNMRKHCGVLIRRRRISWVDSNPSSFLFPFVGEIIVPRYLFVRCAFGIIRRAAIPSERSPRFLCESGPWFHCERSPASEDPPRVSGIGRWNLRALGAGHRGKVCGSPIGERALEDYVVALGEYSTNVVVAVPLLQSKLLSRPEAWSRELGSNAIMQINPGWFLTNRNLSQAGLK